MGKSGVCISVVLWQLHSDQWANIPVRVIIDFCHLAPILILYVLTGETD